MSEKIKNILLEHVGRQNAIKAKHISSLLGFPMEDTQSVSRKAIWDTAEEYGLPLVSCGDGYYLAESAEDVMKFDETMQRRIDGINRTRKLTAENFFNTQKESEKDPET